MPAQRPDRRLFGLEGQVVVVTGASSGIGEACARALGEAGCKVVVNHRPGSKVERARAIAAEISEGPGEAMTAAADVTDEGQVGAMFEAAVERWGTVHGLIANAGIQRGGKFEEIGADQWRQVIDTNLTGQFLACRAALREFDRRGMQPELSKALGKIVCMSSVHQKVPWAFQAEYAAAKGGVMLMMQSLAQETAGRKVRVNALAPGAIQTAINEDVWGDEERLAELMKIIPYGRMGQTSDVTDAALFLLSDLSDYMTGQTLFVDGGMTLYPSFVGNG